MASGIEPTITSAPRIALCCLRRSAGLGLDGRDVPVPSQYGEETACAAPDVEHGPLDVEPVQHGCDDPHAGDKPPVRLV